MKDILKISDFGWSIYLENKNDRRQTFCGTVDYQAPEIVNGLLYDEKIDVIILLLLKITYIKRFGASEFYVMNYYLATLPLKQIIIKTHLKG